MQMKSKIFPLFVAVALSSPCMAHGYEYDQDTTMKLMMEMIVDLGGHDAVSKNSGKSMRCSYGGTRKVSIVHRKANTTYSGDYRNCREKGSIRDGLYKIVLEGDEIVSSSSRRSINGELFDAAMEGNSNRLKELIKAKADVNYTESIQKAEGGTIDEWTPLMSAVMSKNLVAVKLLVSAGAHLNYLNSMTVNALWIAANNGHLEIVKYLVARGAYVNNRNVEDVTPLMAAAMNGHLEVVRSLVAAKALLDLAHKEGDTALMFALAGGQTGIARLLVEAGADLNVRNRFGITALHIAAAEQNLEGAKLLIARKANSSARTTNGKTALDVARDKGNAGIVKLLEEADRAHSPS
ncbi:MAG: ankyrin repeat domain-containing protein [Verrucomicrobia bacterium]|nr:ankyrin repeat domain-containing protein [Deltaproteobacteria bacterium]